MRISDWSSDVCSSDLYPYLCWEQRLTKGVMAPHFLKLRERLASPPDWDEAKSLSPTPLDDAAATSSRTEEHTSQLQALRRLSSAAFFLKKKSGPHPLNSLGHEPDLVVREHDRNYDTTAKHTCR